MAIWTVFCLGTALLAGVLSILFFGSAILNGCVKGRVERAFAKAHPGNALRLGQLSYSAHANCLIAQSLTLSSTNWTLQTGRISLVSVRWLKLLQRTNALPDALADAELEATNLETIFPGDLYRLRCARIKASAANSELVTEKITLQPLVRDEAFFAAHPFRIARLHGALPECRVSGLVYKDLLRGTACRAGAIRLARPSLEVLVNHDKPLERPPKPPLMVNELLAALGKPLLIASLSITNGSLNYCERTAVGAAPGVLTFGAVTMTAEDIANRGDARTLIRIQAQGEFMNAGLLKLQMTIPAASPNLSLHYSGSLGPMDLPRLNTFLENAEHIRITSGILQEASFEIEVIAGRAHGQVRALYRDLELAVLNKETGSEKGLDSRVVSLWANLLKIRSSNVPGGPIAMKGGVVYYVRQPEDRFLQFVWFALRSGILDVISHY